MSDTSLPYGLTPDDVPPQDVPTTADIDRAGGAFDGAFDDLLGLSGGGGLLDEELPDAVPSNIPEWMRTGMFGQGTNTAADLAGTRVTLYPDYGARGSAIFPSSLPGTADYRQYRNALWSMTARDLATLQERLWRAGYYGTVDPRSAPRQGVIGPDTANAWQMFLNDVVAYSDAGVTGDELLAQRMNATAPMHAQAGAAAASIGTQVMTSTDPARIEKVAQDAARSALGRRLSPDEAAAIVSVVSSQEVSALMNEGSLRQQDALRAAGFNADGSPIGGGQPMPRFMTGGGPDSVAARFANELAQAFGVTVVSGHRSDESNEGRNDHRDGLSFDFAGPEENLDRLNAWMAEHASTPTVTAEGPYPVVHTDAGALVDVAELRGLDDDDAEPDHLHVTFRDGAAVPDFAALTQAPSPTRDLDAFMAAVKPDRTSPQQYLVDPSRGQNGAYGLSRSQMRSALRSAGLPEDATDARSQDAAARAYAQDLYNEFKDWRLVAIAFKSSRSLARTYQRTRAIERLPQATGEERPPMVDAEPLPPSAVSASRVLSRYLRQFGKDMANYRPTEPLEPMRIDDPSLTGASMGASGGGVVIAPSVDPTARAELEVERKHGNEAGAHSAALAWDAMMQMMRSSTAPSSVTDNPGALT